MRPWKMKLLRRWAVWYMKRREPDVVIRGEYLRRWHVIPRNRFFNIYLHVFGANDPGPEMHDHPWNSWSLMLAGLFIERTPEECFIISPGRWVRRSAGYAHRLFLESPYAVTIFVTGPVIRDWGFLTSNGWVHWRTHIANQESNV